MFERVNKRQEKNKKVLGSNPLRGVCMFSICVGSLRVPPTVQKHAHRGSRWMGDSYIDHRCEYERMVVDVAQRWIDYLVQGVPRLWPKSAGTGCSTTQDPAGKD